MKHLLFLIGTLLSCTPNDKTAFKDGDIIFHTSKSQQSVLLQQITKSKLTHCGTLFYKKGTPYVYEAVQPVKITPLNKWIERGIGGRYAVIRLKEKLTEKQKSKMQQYALRQMGKDYDIQFEWSDQNIYCSELVWKCYYIAGIQLTPLKTFRDYYDPELKTNELIQKRFKNKLNLDEQVVSPADVYASELIKIVYSNY